MAEIPDLSLTEMAIVERTNDFRRAEGLGLIKRNYSRMTCVMDITATHLNGNPLRLAALLAADDFNFMHDVCGIARHLNRDRVRPVLAITGEPRAASTWQRTAHEIGYDMAQLFASLLLDEVARADDSGVVLS